MRQAIFSVGRKVSEAMWFRRRRTPLWVWILAALGLKSLWVWRARQEDPAFDTKRREFREKMDEAWDVWRQKPDSSSNGSAGE